VLTKLSISSGRASLTRSSTRDLPPTAVLSYSISKVGLNALTIEMQKTEDTERGNVKFYAANPGHCATALNGFRGTKDPKEGAEVVVRLVGMKGDEWKGGSFVEFEEGVMRPVPW
jgi:NAD(P)-dependent dehydrogenase (short-subunit alcohol dehydrogenase family)